MRRVASGYGFDLDLVAFSYLFACSVSRSGPMIGENRQLVINELVEFEK